MRKTQQRASLHERAVQKVAADNVKFTPKRGKDTRQRNSKVTKSHWSDGVDPRVVKAVTEMNIRQVWRYIEVVNGEEVIIHNNPVR